MHRRSWVSSIFVTVSASILALWASFPNSDSLLAVPVLAQAQAPAATTPTFRTDASYVRVDVFATANGRPVVDLTADDFEVFEDGQRQTISQFEYINVQAAAPEVIRQEAASVAQSRLPSIDPRARVIILFLDSAHVDDASTVRIRQPLLTMLRGMLVESDLIAVMTPDMSARDLAFTHKTGLLENILERHPFWGENARLRSPDPAEETLRSCYPRAQALVDELLARRRAKRTFDSLVELVAHLRDVREERKTIIAVTSGWRLFRPDSRIDDLLERNEPPIPLLPFDPRGRPVTEQTGGGITTDICAPMRMELTALDLERTFRDVIALANRANASFYPVDPGGLRTTTEASRGARLEGTRHAFESGNPASNVRELAAETDGTATVGTNDLINGLRAAMQDSSAYYLMGYQSSGKLDGKFHSISVRVKRPGVTVRARKGYLSSVVSRSPATPPALTVAESATASVIRRALDRLARAARDVPVQATVGVGWSPSGTAPAPAFTVVGEVRDKTREARMEVTIAKESGEPVGAARTVLPAGIGAAALTIPATDGLPAGSYVARVRIETDGGSDTLTLPIRADESPAGTGALYFRRRGTQDVPTADLRFRRTEQMLVAFPVAAGGATARLVDRNGQPIAQSLATTVRTLEGGATWTAVRPSLASLAPGDYLIEFAIEGQRVMAPFRVVP
jgi:VWFA-related protein